ncbi:hypothetical protein ACHSBP_02355 [Pseudoalteromonas sp. XMcav1-K]|uniref:hypothetical protein n=1 Tax=Pseudoalteromonas sp. XMcav1-K TaxID=3374372 RepID=UPI00375838B7
MYTERRTRWFFRVFSIATALGLITMLDGDYSYRVQGNEVIVNATDQPFKFYTSVIVDASLYVISTWIGFFSKDRPTIGKR